MTRSTACADVVVGVDGSEQSYAAARFGLQEAQSLGCDVVLLHAYALAHSDFWTDGACVDLRTTGEGLLQDAADRLSAEALGSTQIMTQLCPGDPATALTQVSDDSACIVVGRRSAGWLQHVLVSSVSARVSRVARCPSVTVTRPWESTIRDGPVAVIVDSVAEAGACLAYAMAAAARRGSAVTVTHAAPPGCHEWPSDEDILDVGTVVERSRVTHPGISLTSVVTREPVDVTAAALSAQSSALVVSQAGSPNLVGWRRSPVRAVLKRAACPVITVPTDR